MRTAASVTVLISLFSSLPDIIFIDEEGDPFKLLSLPYYCMPTFRMGTGIFEGAYESEDVFGGVGGCELKEVLGLSQYRKHRLAAVIPTTSIPIATDCHPLDTDVPSLDAPSLDV